MSRAGRVFLAVVFALGTVVCGDVASYAATVDEDALPWRWSDTWGGWVSEASELTWVDGDVVAETPPAGQQVWVAVPPIPARVEDVDPTYHAGPGDAPGVAIGDGSGVGFVVQTVPHDTVPDLGVDPAALFGDSQVGVIHDFDWSVEPPPEPDPPVVQMVEILPEQMGVLLLLGCIVVLCSGASLVMSFGTRG